jgi:methylthioribose-1-phosphate isomerase
VLTPVTPTLADSVRLTENELLILDRRVFPFERQWVRCETAEEAARAIEDMVTQSSGPLFAASAAMVLAAREARHLGTQAAAACLRAAGQRLIATRPTNNHIRDAVRAILDVLNDGSLAGDDLVSAVDGQATRNAAAYRARCAALGEHASGLLPDGAAILTHCWADLFLIATLDAARRAGKQLTFVCTETRPYLQGARLTAATLREYGYVPTIITDGMIPAALGEGLADLVLVAADRVTLDGHVVNKVGTLAAALAAQAYGVPFYALVDAPDPQAPRVEDVVIERRNGAEVLHVLGKRTAAEGVTGYYPAFDVTPPGMVTRIVTAKGAFAPSSVALHFAGGQGARAGRASLWSRHQGARGRDLSSPGSGRPATWPEGQTHHKGRHGGTW